MLYVIFMLYVLCVILLYVKHLNIFPDMFVAFNSQSFKRSISETMLEKMSDVFGSLSAISMKEEPKGDTLYYYLLIIIICVFGLYPYMTVLHCTSNSVGISTKWVFL
jgi:hypothetical protein